MSEKHIPEEYTDHRDNYRKMVCSCGHSLPCPYFIPGEIKEALQKITPELADMMVKEGLRPGKSHSESENWVNHYCGFGLRQDLAEKDTFTYANMIAAYEGGKEHSDDTEPAMKEELKEDDFTPINFWNIQSRKERA